MAAVSNANAGTGTGPPDAGLSRDDQTLLLFAGLMEGGKEEDETVAELDRLSKLLGDDVAATGQGERSICQLIDSDCVDTLLGYLDMRQPEVVRGHGTLATSAYLRAAGDEGAKKLSAFFYDRVRRGTYDDYIVAFCVAAALFPIVPELTAEMFLSEGFLPSLGPLMRRKWKSRKVETACLELLNVACMNGACREAVQKYCGDWLEEIVDQDPDDVVKAMFAANPDLGSGSVSMRRHSRQVQNLAAVILAKIKATMPLQKTGKQAGERVQLASTTLEELSKMFAKLLVEGGEEKRSEDEAQKDGTTTTATSTTTSSVEGLAYASLQPRVKEDLAGNAAVLRRLIQTLQTAPARSPLTYGGLSILANLTRYRPTQTEEQRRMGQLKAYADAAGKGGKLAAEQRDQLDDDEHVAQRCQQVFAAGVMPVLVSHSRRGSPASLGLIVGIVHALSVTARLRGQLAQQGAVRLLMDVWEGEETSRGTGATPTTTPTTTQRTAAQALARILISTNPALVFGGTRGSTPMAAAIRPLASLLRRPDDDDNAGPTDLLPTFEALMALTNLASTEDDDVRRAIIRTAWADVDEQLLARNPLVARAAAELVCNIVQGVDGIALYAVEKENGDPALVIAARNRLNVLLALADAEDAATRCAAGGALAGLTAYPAVVRGVLARPAGVDRLLGLCAATETEDLRHRGAVAVYNVAAADGDTGRAARVALRAANAVTILTDCAKASRRPEVIEAVVFALKAVVDGNEGN
ncbi:actin cytoskeleton organization protein [Grosmannia clavigera kw1407]|uniref:Actin cytoskeleton organization protein n=1 Tax=Grosmannia clavigera (strain kw1407 / UAMH 11150) TaxID=655863 RepID=F0X7E6_GROCL|nr:actin cytoskeleton organization protein [Grosmannia clavigera kw1407]EFX06555.1 actin cytoskeleton organization protein [Grosmannia clavigera kw1407]